MARFWLSKYVHGKKSCLDQALVVEFVMIIIIIIFFLTYLQNHTKILVVITVLSLFSFFNFFFKLYITSAIYQLLHKFPVR